MNVHEDANAFSIYVHVRKNQKQSPNGIALGTLELGTDW